MEKEIIFLENANPYKFAVWLKEYMTRGVALRRFAVLERNGYRKSYYTLEPIHFPQLLPINAWLEIRGFRVFLPDAMGMDIDTIPTPSWLARFRMCPLGSKRLEVVIECREPAIMGYIDEIVRGMMRHWPGSRRIEEGEK